MNVRSLAVAIIVADIPWLFTIAYVCLTRMTPDTWGIALAVFFVAAALPLLSLLLAVTVIRALRQDYDEEEVSDEATASV